MYVHLGTYVHLCMIRTEHSKSIKNSLQQEGEDGNQIHQIVSSLNHFLGDCPSVLDTHVFYGLSTHYHSAYQDCYRRRLKTLMFADYRKVVHLEAMVEDPWDKNKAVVTR